MAEADRKLIPVTWTPLSAVHEHVVKICISPSEAGPWLVKQIAAKPPRVRKRHRGVRPAGASIDDFWTGSPPTIDFADNSATKLAVLPPGAGAAGTYFVTLLGVEVVLEDIKAQQSAFPSAILEPVTPEPVAMTAEQREEWLRTAIRTFPCRPGETKPVYAARLREEMKKAGITPVYSQPTMERIERRLRNQNKEE